MVREIELTRNEEEKEWSFFCCWSHCDGNKETRMEMGFGGVGFEWLCWLLEASKNERVECLTSSLKC